MKGISANLIIGLFMLLVVLVVFGALIGDINTAISNLLPSLNTSEATLVQLFPLVIVIVILAALISGRIGSDVMQ